MSAHQSITAAPFDAKAMARDFRKTLTVAKQIELLRAMIDSLGEETDSDGIDILFHLDRADDALINAGEDYAEQRPPCMSRDDWTGASSISGVL